MKKCTGCGQTKPESDFQFRKDQGRLVAKCKLCVLARQSRWARSQKTYGSRSQLTIGTNDKVREQKDKIMFRIAGHVALSAAGCMEWLTAKTRSGYGVLPINIDGIWFQFGVHRLIACLFHGLDLLSPDEFACHHCDNPACVSVTHIYKGNAKQNTQDRESRNRGRWSKCML